MHFQNHRELGRIIASERVRQASRVHAEALRQRPPPPLRARAAHAAALYHLATVQTARLEQRKTAEHFHCAAEEIYLCTHGRLS